MRSRRSARLVSKFCAYSAAVTPSIPGAPSLRVSRYASLIHSKSMTWCSVDKATPRFDLASSAIRCRFVYRFSRPKVLSHVARQRFSPRGTPLSSVGSQRAWFPDVVGRTEVLRLPMHAFPVAYLVRFRVPHDPSGQDPCSAGDPSYPAFSSRGREWDLSGFQATPPVPLLRSRTPAESTVPRHDGLADAAPAVSTTKASAIDISGLLRGFSTCCLRFMGDVATAHARLASGWLAGLYREGVEPSGSR